MKIAAVLITPVVLFAGFSIEYGFMSFDYPMVGASVWDSYYGGEIDLGLGDVGLTAFYGSMPFGKTCCMGASLFLRGIGVGYVYDSTFGMDSISLGLRGNLGKLEYSASYIHPSFADLDLEYRLGKFFSVEAGGMGRFKNGLNFRIFTGVGFNFLGIKLSLKGYLKVSDLGFGIGGISLGFGYEDPKLYKALLSVETGRSSVRTFSTLTVEDLKKSPLSLFVYKYDIFGKRPAVGTIIDYSYEANVKGETKPIEERTMVGRDGRAVLAYDPQSGIGLIHVKVNIPPDSFLDFGAVEESPIARDLVESAKAAGMVKGNTMTIDLKVSPVPDSFAVVERGAEDYYTYDPQNNAVILNESRLDEIKDNLTVSVKVMGTFGGSRREVKVSGMAEVDPKIYIFNLNDMAFDDLKSESVSIEAGLTNEGFDLDIRNLDIEEGEIAFVVLNYKETVGGESLKSFSDYFIIALNEDDAIRYMDYVAGLSDEPQAVLGVYPRIEVEGEPLENYGKPILSVTTKIGERLRESFESVLPGKNFYLPYGINLLTIRYPGIEDVKILLKVDESVSGVKITLTNEGICTNPVKEVGRIIWSNAEMCGDASGDPMDLTVKVKIRRKTLYLLTSIPGKVRVDGDYAFEEKGEGIYRIVRGKGEKVLNLPSNSGVAFDFVSSLEKVSSLIFKPRDSKAAYFLPLEGKYNTDYSYYFIRGDHPEIYEDPKVVAILKIPGKWARTYSRMRVYGIIAEGGMEYLVPVGYVYTGRLEEDTSVKLDGITYKLDIGAIESTFPDGAYSPKIFLYGDLPVNYYVILYNRRGEENDPVRFNLSEVREKGYYETIGGNIMVIDLDKVSGGYEEKEY